jgi:hypothetical protein
MPISQTDQIVHIAGVLSTRVDKEMVILNMATNQYIALDQIGRRIWDLTEKPVQVDVLCQQLSVEFTGDPQQIRADVMDFLAELLAEGLLHVESA